MLLIRMGYKMLLVWRCAPQKEDHIEKDETLLVGSGAQKVEECKDSGLQDDRLSRSGL